MIVKDVVCSVILDSGDAVGQVEYEGDTYYFCSRGCKREFERTSLTRPVPRIRQEQRLAFTRRKVMP